MESGTATRRMTVARAGRFVPLWRKVKQDDNTSQQLFALRSRTEHKKSLWAGMAVLALVLDNTHNYPKANNSRQRMRLAQRRGQWRAALWQWTQATPCQSPKAA